MISGFCGGHLPNLRYCFSGAGAVVAALSSCFSVFNSSLALFSTATAMA